MDYNVLNFPILSLVTFAPLAGVPIILFMKQEKQEQIKWVAFVVSLLTFLISLVVLFNFTSGETSVSSVQLVERVTWIGAWGIEYYLGVDGISIWLLMLTTLISPIAIVSSFTAIQERVKEYYIFMLLMQTAMTGVFLALDMFLFYVFWEFTLVPMYFLIGIWGGPRRVYAAIKFFLYTMAGSILMLLAILYLGLQGDTFSVPDLISQNARWVGSGAEIWLFLAFAAAFAIKVPLWPFHSWLPDAHVEAPTAGSVLLAAILLKMGTYGFVRFNLPLFPQASHDMAPIIAILAIIGIIYGAIVSFAQTDVKKLVAYSSVSHLGFVMLGIFALNPQGIQGGILQMVNHGLSTGALFLLVGVLYERRHTRDMGQFGGLWKIMPLYGTITLIVTLSSMGLPGLNGFVGEFVILQGAFAHNWIWAAFAASGVILAAIYMLTMFQKLFLGQSRDPANAELAEQPLRWHELVALIPILALIFWIGLYPAPFFRLMDAAVARVLSIVGSGALVTW
jgi:NADH-quinone oxidoreductase subunit M